MGKSYEAWFFELQRHESQAAAAVVVPELLRLLAELLARRLC
jgi:hypothetical protein